MNRILFSLPVLCVALVGATSAYSIDHHRAKAQALADTSNSVRLLSADDIKKEIVGNTITGIEKGKSYTEYLKPDGTISGSEQAGAYNGAWRLEGDRICVTYDPDEDATSKEHQWDCSPLARRGDDLFWSDSVASDDPAEATLIPGNPKKSRSEVGAEADAGVTAPRRAESILTSIPRIFARISAAQTNLRAAVLPIAPRRAVYCVSAGSAAK